MLRVLRYVLLLSLFPGMAGVLPAQTPFDLKQGERIAFVGNSLAERMSLFGHFETFLHSRFPERELVVRNFGWPTDTVFLQQRPNDYTHVDDPLKVFGPDTLICFFGFNESFAGSDRIESFKSQLKDWIDQEGKKYARDGRPPRFVLVSPIAFEDAGDPLRPDDRTENANLKLYTAAMAETARELEIPFVDLFTPTGPLFAAEPGLQFTINGAHLNERGDLEASRILDEALFQSENPGKPGTPGFEKLRAAVNDKSWYHEQDYRMINGWYVYGSRSTPFGVVNFPEEITKLRNMVAERDRYVWDIAQGKSVPPRVDDGGTGVLSPVKTTFGSKRYSEPEELRYLSPEEALKAMTPAPGYQVQTFASEQQFPELANPVQLNFDNRGRLWVSCMPTYPQWQPGDPKPDDRLLILEDTDLDGVADNVKVFARGLHVPTGFEFWNGGVLVVSQPKILFLKDTDGDDRADVRTTLLDGFATGDTHHAIGAWEWTPGGRLVMLEGIAVSTCVETPWGPFRNRNTPGAYFFDPRTLKLDRHVTLGYGNPWCYTQNFWGQGFVGDGTNAQQHWDTPLSGAPFEGRRGTRPFVDNEGMRPAIGNEFIYSRHFPDDAQGDLIYACVINMNGIMRFKVWEEGSGYAGERVEDLLKSSDKNFRPADPKIGPDGALYFGDWHNALIGHMQYSQRDPNRDHTHGRVYRLTAKGQPLIQPVTQYGKSIPELLDQLKEYEKRTRYRARRELRDRDSEAVVAAVKNWVKELDPNDPSYDHNLTEALWVLEGHHAVDKALLRRVLQAKTPDARAAATHVLGNERDYVDGTLDLLKPMVEDEHPRVRLEAVRGLSFFNTPDAVEAALEVVKKPLDYYLRYTLGCTLSALKSQWDQALASDRLANENPEGLNYLKEYAFNQSPAGEAKQRIQFLMNTDNLRPRARRNAIHSLAGNHGDAKAGEEVFSRICVACHKMGDMGILYGPDLSQVAGRLTREEIIESIIFPSAKVDPKFQATNIETKDGEAFTGFLASETDEAITLILGGGIPQTIAKNKISERETLSVSSMPEGLPAAMSAREFLDLVEFLSEQK